MQRALGGVQPIPFPQEIPLQLVHTPEFEIYYLDILTDRHHSQATKQQSSSTSTQRRPTSSSAACALHRDVFSPGHHYTVHQKGAALQNVQNPILWLKPPIHGLFPFGTKIYIHRWPLITDNPLVFLFFFREIKEYPSQDFISYRFLEKIP